MIHAFLSAGKLLLLAILVAEGFSRIGGAQLPLFRKERAAGLEFFGLGFLVGLALAAMAFLGLALCGIYYPSVLVAACVLLLGVSFLIRPARVSVVGGALTEGGREGLVFLALALLPLLPHLLIPETEQDAFIYHLGMPWEYLQAHRAVLERVPASFHMPLPVEMCYSLPLILGDDRLAKVLGVLSFLAVAALIAGPASVGRPFARRFLSPLLALSCGYAAWLMQRSKGDLGGAAWVVAGLILGSRRAYSLSALFLGMGIAAKLIYAPLVGFWLLFVPPPRHRWLVIGAGLALSLLPWLAKSYLATGAPVFPMGAVHFSPPDWDVRNQEAWKAYAGALWQPDTLRAIDLPAAWIRLMARDYLLVLVILPGLLYVRATRMAAVACVLAQVSMLGVGHMPRYVLPSAWFLSFLAAKASDALPSRAHVWVTRALAVAALAVIVARTELGGRVWSQAVSAPGVQRERLLSTYGEAALLAGQLQADRLLSVGEMRTYLLPGRVIYGGALGETPLMWKMASESGDEERLRIKMRQLGANALLFNYVSVDWLINRYEAFSWDDRMLGIYRRYAKRHLEVLGRTQTNNYTHGGFYLYAVRPTPLSSVPESVWFLPGTESIYARMIVLEKTGGREGALGEALEILQRLPDVGHAWNVVGHAYAQLNDAPNAYRYLAPFAAQGMMDAMNLWELGVVLVPLGRLDEAEALIEDAITRYPDQLESLHIHQALLYSQRARRAIKDGRPEEGKPLLDRSLDLLAEAPEPDKADLADAYRKTHAVVKGLLGEYYLVRGEKAKAAAFFREAASIDPGGQLARYCERQAERLGSRVLSLGKKSEKKR